MAMKAQQSVNERLLHEVVWRIVRALDPEKIILFGSYAYGGPHEGSDLDLIVIMESHLPRYKRAVPLYQTLAGIMVPKDILVYTPEEIRAWEALPQAFITQVIRKGRVLYEKRVKDLILEKLPGEVKEEVRDE